MFYSTWFERKESLRCPVDQCACPVNVKTFSFPETGAQAYCHAHESQALSLETFPDIFDASLFSRHTHTHTHTPEDTFIWRKREVSFTWNSVTILPVDTNNNIWTRPINSKKSCGRWDASIAVHNNRQRSHGVRSQFCGTAQRTHLDSPIWASPQKVLKWYRLHCLQEVLKLT